MAKITDEAVKKWIGGFKRKIIKKYSPEKIILFGSRARNDNLIESDVDIIIVSEKFKGIPWPRRLADVGEEWEGLVDIEPLCYTPEEFQSKKKKPGIVKQAVEEGVRIF